LSGCGAEVDQSLPGPTRGTSYYAQGGGRPVCEWRGVSASMQRQTSQGFDPLDGERLLIRRAPSPLEPCATALDVPVRPASITRVYGPARAVAQLAVELMASHGRGAVGAGPLRAQATRKLALWDIPSRERQAAACRTIRQRWPLITSPNGRGHYKRFYEAGVASRGRRARHAVCFAALCRGAGGRPGHCAALASQGQRGRAGRRLSCWCAAALRWKTLWAL